MEPLSIIDLPTFEQIKNDMGLTFRNEVVEAFCVETPLLMARLQQALAQILSEAHDRVESDLTATKAGLEQLSADVRKVESQLIDVGTEVRSAVQHGSETHSALAVLDKRSCRVESDLQVVQDRVLSLTTFRSASEEQAQNISSRLASVATQVTALALAVERFDKSLQSYGLTAGGVSSLCERVVESQASLDARLAEHATAIEQLRADVAHRGSLMDNLFNSLRSLEGRRESRQDFARDVKVVMVDEAEASISGRVVDVSDSGLGVRLESSVPVGSRLRLDVGGSELVGEVAYCRKQGPSHRVGLKSVSQERDRKEVEK